MDTHMLQVPPPRKGRIQRIAVTTTAATTALGSVVSGMGWVRVRARGANVQFFFTNSGADTCDIDAATGNTCGWPLMNGQAEDYYLSNETHIAWDSDGVGFIDIMRAGQERTGKR